MMNKDNLEKKKKNYEKKTRAGFGFEIQRSLKELLIEKCLNQTISNLLKI
jgi:hypothetical protein